MSLLDYFHLVCGKNYKLFTVGELPKSSGASVTEEEIVAMIDRLDKDGYVDVRYRDGKEILLKPLNKSYSADAKQTPDHPTETAITRVRVGLLFLALCAFFGGLVGAVVGVLLARVVC